MNLKCFFSCVTSVLFIFSSVLMRVKGESSKNGWLRLFDCNKLIITRLEEYNKDPHTKDTISSFCDGLWLRFSMWLYNGWRVSVNDIQEEFILHKIWARERDTQVFYIAWKTELIITITNVCCLHLWVYVFISVFLYLFACEKEFEFETFGETTVLQSEVTLNPHFYTADMFNLLNECVIGASIFMAECTETKRVWIYRSSRCSLLSEKCWSGLSGRTCPIDSANAV